MASFTLDDALDVLVEYTLQEEYDFAREEMNRHDNFEDWAKFILSETIYGAASVVAFRNNSEAEMMRDLRQIWDNA
jgi:hypothetical protein